MAKPSLSDSFRIRPAMSQDAPWSSRATKAGKASDRASAVVYVIGAEGGERYKIGCTTQLRKRLTQLARAEGEQLHMHFWAEFDRSVAFEIETRALRDARAFHGVKGRGEWFTSTAQALAAMILAAADSLGIKPIIHAGWPGALDPSPTEIEKLLSEPVSMQPTLGRLDREEWAPQSRSVGG